MNDAGFTEQQSAFFVGQMVTARGVNSRGNVNVTTNTRIVSIDPEYANDVQYTQITFADVITRLTQVGDTFTGVTLFETAAANPPVLSFTDISLVLSSIGPSPTRMQLPVQKWGEVRFNIPINTTQFSKVFDIDANCGMVMFLNNSNNLISSDANIGSWRFDIDGFQTTDRDIQYKSPLYLDRLTKAFNVMGYMVNSVDPILFLTNRPHDAGNANALIAITELMPADGSRHQLHLHLKATAGNHLPNQISMFKLLNETISV